LAQKRTRFSASVEVLEGRALMAFSTLLAQSLVTQDYQVFLQRLPEPSGLTFWTNQITSGTSPVVVGAKIANSAESASSFVTSAYRYYLGRVPASSEVRFWAGKLENGMTTNQVAADILGSSEYYALAGGTNAGFVSSLYTQVLGRAVDSAGGAYWLNQLAHGLSRTNVAYDFTTSIEGSAFEVTQGYQVILGRTPEPAGLSYWKNLLAGKSPKLSEQQFAVDLINSTENINRIDAAIAAGTIVTNQDAAALLTPATYHANFAITPQTLSFVIDQGPPLTVTPPSATFTVTDVDSSVPLAIEPVVVPAAASAGVQPLPAGAATITDPNGNVVGGIVVIQPGQSETFTVTINPADVPYSEENYEAQIALKNGGGLVLTPLSGAASTGIIVTFT
jgi:hypothetical protein